jgi:hypothetical protein
MLNKKEEEKKKKEKELTTKNQQIIPTCWNLPVPKKGSMMW